MKYSPFKTVSEIANMLMILLLSYAATYFISIVGFHEFDLYPLIFDFIVVTYYYLFRKLIHRISIYITCNVLATALTVTGIFVILRSNTEMLIMLTVFTAFFFILNFVYILQDPFDSSDFGAPLNRLSQRETRIVGSIPVWFVAVCIILYMVSYVIDIKEQNIFYYMGVLYFALYFVRIFFINAYTLGKNNINDESMPYYKMIRNDSKLAFPALILITVTMLVVRLKFVEEWFLKSFIWLMDNIVVKVVSFAIYIYNTVVDWFLSLFDFGNEVLEVEPEELLDESFYTEESVLSMVLSYIAMLLVAALLVFIVYKGVMAVVSAISARRKIPEKGITEEEEDVVEFRERIVRTKSKKRAQVYGIRKEYRDTVDKLSSKGYAVKMNQTPRERKTDVYVSKGKDISTVTFAYESQRYKKEE